MNDTITKELEQYVGKYFRFKDKFSYNAQVKLFFLSWNQLDQTMLS